MIEAHELTKRYGDTTAVDRSSFTIAPGSVTGFLGPNGAGKSTTMRMIMGLDRPTTGTVTINGKPYAQHRSPLSEAGALLDAKAVHPGRSARSHLLPGVLSFISLAWVEKIVDYLPLPASGAFLGGGRDSLSSTGEALSPTTGILVIAAYALVPLIIGAVVLRRRDA